MKHHFRNASSFIALALFVLPHMAQADEGQPSPDSQSTVASDPPPATTGVIEVPLALMTVMIDGEYVRVHQGRVVVACGTHRVNAGRGTTTVDIPCGGILHIQVPKQAVPYVEPHEMQILLEQHDSKRRGPLRFGVDGGYSAHKLFDIISVMGVEGGLAFSGQPYEHFAIRTVSRFFWGSSDNNLDVFMARVGAEAGLVFGRFHFDLGLSALFTGVHRAVRRSTIVGVGPSIHAAARFDVVRSRRVAIFARGMVAIALAPPQWNSSVWGFAFGPGVDFDLNDTREQRRQPE